MGLGKAAEIEILNAAPLPAPQFGLTRERAIAAAESMQITKSPSTM
jgi:hypothetical protein